MYDSNFDKVTKVGLELLNDRKEMMQMGNIDFALIGVCALIIKVCEPCLVKSAILYVAFFAVSYYFNGTHAVLLFLAPVVATIIGYPLGLAMAYIVKIIKNLFR